MYIFIHLCDNLQIFAICYLYYDVQWFCFWGCGLSTERVVAHPLHLLSFLPRCASIGYYWMAATLYSSI